MIVSANACSVASSHRDGGIGGVRGEDPLRDRQRRRDQRRRAEHARVAQEVPARELESNRAPHLSRLSCRHARSRSAPGRRARPPTARAPAAGAGEPRPPGVARRAPRRRRRVAPCRASCRRCTYTARMSFWPLLASWKATSASLRPTAQTSGENVESCFRRTGRPGRSAATGPEMIDVVHLVRLRRARVALAPVGPGDEARAPRPSARARRVGELLVLLRRVVDDLPGRRQVSPPSRERRAKTSQS